MINALLTIGTILFLTFVMSYAILRKAVANKALRRVLMMFVVLTPPIAIFALIRGLLFSRPKPIRYIEDFGRIEDEIETERAQMFGENVMHPSFSQRWRLSYLYAIEKSTAAAVRLDPDLQHSLCGIPQPR
jgi:hypothetical protein